MKSEDKRLLWSLNVRMMKIWEQIKASTDAAEIEKLEKQYNHTLKRTVEEQDRIEAEKVFAQPNLL